LVIYHVDEQAGLQNARGYPGQEGWPENGNHYRVAVMQADGLYDLEELRNEGDEGDLFVAGRSLGPGGGSTYPNTDSYQSGTIVSTGISITDISASGRRMSFRVTGLQPGETVDTPQPSPGPSPRPSPKPSPRPSFRPSPKPSLRPTLIPSPRPSPRPSARPNVAPNTPRPSPRPSPRQSPRPSLESAPIPTRAPVCGFGIGACFNAGTDAPVSPRIPGADCGFGECTDGVRSDAPAAAPTGKENTPAAAPTLAPTGKTILTQAPNGKTVLRKPQDSEAVAAPRTAGMIGMLLLTVITWVVSV
jgi:hypothetical protein